MATCRPPCARPPCGRKSARRSRYVSCSVRDPFTCCVPAVSKLSSTLPQHASPKRVAEFEASSIEPPTSARSIVLQELLQGCQEVASFLLVSHANKGAAILFCPAFQYHQPHTQHIASVHYRPLCCNCMHCIAQPQVVVPALLLQTQI